MKEGFLCYGKGIPVTQRKFLWEDSACLICRDDAKQKGQLTKKIILTILNPTENDSESLSLLVVNFAQILLSHLLKSVVGCQEIEDLQKISSPHLPSISVSCLPPVVASPFQLPIAKQNMKHEG